MADASPIEPITDAVHLAIDMQNIFAPGGIWATPWMERVLPSIVDITARYQARTVFTRFITPDRADERPGRWRRYFEKWQCATRSQLPPSQLELVPALQRFVLRPGDRQARLFRVHRIAAGLAAVTTRASAPLSSPVRKPTSACWRRCSMPSISAFVW